MLHTKFHGNWSTGSGEEDFRRFFFYHKCTWWPFWSCDTEAVSKLCSTYLQRIHAKFGVAWPNGFSENDI